MKRRDYSGKNNPNYKGIRHYCTDCGKELKSWRPTRPIIRCIKCFAKGRLNPMFGKSPKWGRKKYKNILMKSSWEVAVAMWLDSRGINWQYEPKTFDFDIFTYTPDFYLPDLELWIEVKGYWTEKAMKKFLRFKELWPSSNGIIFLSKKELKELGII